MDDRRYWYEFEVRRVIDGDTLEGLVDVGFYLTSRIRLRLLWVNTPELHSQDPEERVKAQKAKAAMEQKVLGQKLIVKTEKTDSFGRYLADCYLGQEHINGWLLREGLALAKSK